MRASGILLPIFSLPGKYGIGSFSEEAFHFVDFLVEAGQKYWQILPLGPTSYGDSPYQSFSTFAGNPYFISLEKLIEKDLLKKDEVIEYDWMKVKEKIDYSKLYKTRYPILRKAFKRFDSENKEFKKFCKNNKWLNNYALFMALKDAHNGKSFLEWERKYRLRFLKELKNFQKKNKEEILFHMFLQFIFFEQWKALKKYANKKGIQLIGDIPIYVALDSADVWAAPNLFQLDEDGYPRAVAGCPPDGFSSTGQLWGNPLYDWEAHRRESFAWWISRVTYLLQLYDVLRIDHFRGFDEYYAIPAGEETAAGGHWEKGPGLELFQKLEKALEKPAIIAEDLGYLNDSVRKLVKDTGYPGMKLVEFAFDSRDESSNDYLPYRYEKNSVVYTGTHDNETVLGWLSSIQENERKAVLEYLDLEKEISDAELAKKIVRLAIASPSDLCIIPMQDYLGLGNEARINEPSTLGKNWMWRMQKMSDESYSALANEILTLTKLYGR